MSPTHFPRIRRRFSLRIAERAAGFSLIEIIVVVAAIVLISAAIAPRLFSWIDEGRAARAQGDANAIVAAMNRFFQDTTRWPGQVEILKANSATRFLIVGDPGTATFPTFAVSTGIGAATCTSGLSGVTPNVTAFTAATPSSSNSLNVIEFLTKQPSASDYPNWRGPYLAVDLSSDPWARPYVINVIPLFCGETVTSAAPAGALGFGWILSGGPNRTVQTLFTDSHVNVDSDDVGTNLSKLVTPSGT
ncbi:MAG: type II secretion system protein GspG [Acidobacteria bacterium]|nr:type II secretion system protein GspG [Acidobacteriota bacterium]